MSEINDTYLVEAIKSGNKEAFGQIYKMYYAEMCIVANRIVRDKDTAEDIVQNVICKLWEKRDTLNIPNHFKHYLYRAIYNRALNYSDHKKHVINYQSQNQDTKANTFTPENELIKNELQSRITSIIDRLPANTKNIFMMSRYEDKTYSEISKELDVTQKNVEYEMSKALRYLRDNLKDYLLMFVVLFGIYQCTCKFLVEALTKLYSI